jgi:serine phosphatase RsbU (regulator of sigma subunit)
VIPVLRPKYIVLKGAYALLVHLGMHVFYYKQSLAAYAPVISWMAISIVASHTISAVRYYYFKNRYVKRRLLHELLEKVSHRQGQLQRAAAVLQKQNERLQRLIAKKEADKRLLKQQKEQLLQQQDELKQSLQKARQVQYALLLPHASYLQQRFPSSFVLFRAADEVRGDFYLCMHAHGYDWICVGDCTGHGVPGALLSCTSVMVLTDLLQRHKNLTPARLLAFYEERMNRYLHHEAIKLKTGADAGILKISSSGQATFTGRGINLILLRKGILYELRTSRAGLLANRLLVPADDAPGDQVEFFLEAGDRFYLFTDGYKDQLCHRQGKRPKRYGSRRLFHLIESIKDKTPEQQKQLLIDAIRAWRGSDRLNDDVTVVGVVVE